MSSSYCYNEKQLESIRRIIACKNYYEILSIKTDAITEDVKSKFKALALIIHPDKCESPFSNEAFQKLNQAFKILVNPTQRKEYNKSHETENSYIDFQLDTIERILNNESFCEIFALENDSDKENRKKIEKSFNDLNDIVDPDKCKVENSEKAHAKLNMAYQRINKRFSSKYIHSKEQLKIIQQVSNCENYYDILNVGKFATQNEISTRYNHLVEIFSHKNCNNKRCEDAFKKVEKAYEIWSDSEKRFEFIHNCTRKQFDVIECVLNNFNYYNILGVESNATYIEIKQKCKQLFELMQKCKQLFELMQKCKAKESEKVFKKINEAYDVLCNKDKRLDYDIKQNEILKRVLKDDDYYKILDVSVNANNNEIETEHKKLTNTIIHLKLEAETKKLVYEKVQNAYENLRNSEKRFFYDKKCNRYQYDMIEQVRSNNKSFKILGVKSNANKQEINRRFEELKDAIHPSKCKAENSREAFEKVQFAYVTLMNRRKRSCMNCCRRVGKFLRKISPYNRWIFLSLFTVAVLIFLSWLFLVFVLNYGGRSYLTEVTNSTEIANITDENIVTDVSFITNFTEVIPVTNVTNENNVTDASNVTNLTEATTVTIVTELSESTIVTEITNVTDLNDITDQNNVTNNANEIAVTDSDEVYISYDLSDVNDVNDKNNFNIVSTDDFKETVESN